MGVQIRRNAFLMCLLMWAAVAATADDETGFGMSRFSIDRRASQSSYEQALVSGTSPQRLAAHHDAMGSHPHSTGSEGDLAVIEWLRSTFESFGLEVEVQWLDVFIGHPVSAALEVVSPDKVSLAVDEPSIATDPWSNDPRLPIGYNGYSGSGDVAANVVYANFGRKEDFARLSALGVNCKGKIVLARYGGNFRGYKAKYAEEAGAAGLVIFTDPRDSGYMQGLMYPEGGWANETHIQRGSILTLDYVGDPLTPGWAATEEADRLDPATVAFPRIPVQPVGWGAAREIMSRMTGAPVPSEWQGGMPFTYRLEGGPDLRVRLKVEQERKLTRTANVVATLRGESEPDQWVILGSHHDGWAYGASDPLAGTIVVVESARVFSELLRSGTRPKRSILFAAWAAEEHGILGSTEWVESKYESLREGAIAYINLDMASMGPMFNSNSAPLLKELVVDATKVVPQARDATSRVYDIWRARSGRGAEEPRIGSMGGGSDHVAFYCRAGVPCIGMGGSGSQGTAYHSNFDNLMWYRRIVGDDYEPAQMITRVASVVAARLANSDVLALDPGRYAADVEVFAKQMADRAQELGRTIDVGPIMGAAAGLRESAERLNAAIVREMASGGGVSGIAALNDTLLRIERMWLVEEGMPDRAWYLNAWVTPDPWSGYSAWMLPVLRHAVELGTDDDVREAVTLYVNRLSAIAGALDAARAGLTD